MAKRVYTHDQGGEHMDKRGETKVVRAATGKHARQGYDYVDPQASKLAKAAAKGVGRGIARIVAGPKKG